MSTQSATNAAIDTIRDLCNPKFWLFIIVIFGGIFAGLIAIIIAGLYAAYHVHVLCIIPMIVLGVAWFPFWLELTDGYTSKLAECKL